MQRIDGKPIGKWGLRATTWSVTPAGTWQVACPARKERVSLVVQNVGTDVGYLRFAPQTDLGYTGSNGFQLWPRDSITIDSWFPWLDALEATVAAAGAQFTFSEVWDGSPDA